MRIIQGDIGFEITLHLLLFTVHKLEPPSLIAQTVEILWLLRVENARIILCSEALGLSSVAAAQAIFCPLT